MWESLAHFGKLNVTAADTWALGQLNSYLREHIYINKRRFGVAISTIMYPIKCDVIKALSMMILVEISAILPAAKTF